MEYTLNYAINHIMKIKIILIILVLCICTSHTAYTAPLVQNPSQNIKISTRSALVGLWGMHIPENKKCMEYYNFQSNHQVFIRSGAEWSYGQYTYQASSDSEISPLLVLNIRYDNNEKDCSGIKEDQSGEITRFTVVWRDASNIEFCSDSQDQECFAALRRIQP